MDGVTGVTRSIKKNPPKTKRGDSAAIDAVPIHEEIAKCFTHGAQIGSTIVLRVDGKKYGVNLHQCLGENGSLVSKYVFALYTGRFKGTSDLFNADAIMPTPRLDAEPKSWIINERATLHERLEAKFARGEFRPAQSVPR